MTKVGPDRDIELVADPPERRRGDQRGPRGPVKVPIAEGDRRAAQVVQSWNDLIADQAGLDLRVGAVGATTIGGHDGRCDPSARPEGGEDDVCSPLLPAEVDRQEIPGAGLVRHDRPEQVGAEVWMCGGEAGAGGQQLRGGPLGPIGREARDHAVVAGECQVTAELREEDCRIVPRPVVDRVEQQVVLHGTGPDVSLAILPGHNRLVVGEGGHAGSAGRCGIGRDDVVLIAEGVRAGSGRGESEDRCRYAEGRAEAFHGKAPPQRVGVHRVCCVPERSTLARVYTRASGRTGSHSPPEPGRDRPGAGPASIPRLPDPDRTWRRLPPRLHSGVVASGAVGDGASPPLAPRAAFGVPGQGHHRRTALRPTARATARRMQEPGEITRYLSAARDGDRAALDLVFARVYAELRRIAAAQVRRVGGENTLGTTAVVHEVYLKLARGAHVDWADRAHFYAVAARAMRQVLLNHARSHLAGKRGAGRPLPLDESTVAAVSRATEILEMDTALERLAVLDERMGRVVELRYYAGLSVEETAGLLGVTDRTVKRDWRAARAFLYRELHGGDR